MRDLRELMVQEIAAKLEPILLVTCHVCGTKQIVDTFMGSAEGAASDLIYHGWLLVDHQPWCPNCVEQLGYGRAL